MYEILRDRIFGWGKEIFKDSSTENCKKVLYNIDLAERTNDSKLFKKLSNWIWEFRTQYAGLQIRLLAFWDKTDKKETLVIATQGFIKKVDKVSSQEIDRATMLRDKYFERKQKGKWYGN